MSAGTIIRKKWRIFIGAEVITTGIEFIAEDPIPDEPTYPSEFFAANPGKPKMILDHKVPPLEEIRPIVYEKLKRNELDVDGAILYLIAYFRTVKVTLKKDWKSFNVAIGAKGDEISIENIIQISEGAKSYAGTSLDRVSPKNDLWITFYILSIYNLLSTRAINYRAKLITEAIDLIKTLTNERPPPYKQAISKYSHWMYSINYNFIVATIDMLLYNNKELVEQQVLLFGTRCSCIKHCGTLIVILHLSDKCPSKNVLDWIFIDEAVEELNRVCEPGQEIGKKESYFAYLKDLALVDVSPYSVEINSNLVTILNSAGTFMGSEWCKDAHLIENDDTYSCVFNGLIMAYAQSNRSIPSGGVKKITSDKSEEAITENFALCESANDFRRWFKLNGPVMNKYLKNYLRSRKANLDDLKMGSIGKYIMDKFN